MLSPRSLVHEREAHLSDGARLLRHDRYDALKQQLGVDDRLMRRRHRLLRVHPDFRIVALAEPPDASGSDTFLPSNHQSPT